MDKLIDFSQCTVNPLKWFDGANGNKISISYNGKNYMLKFPTHPKGDPLANYTNSCVSEYLGCHILNSIGIPAQETLLGNYQGKRVVACGDLETNGFLLRSFATLKNAVISSETAGYGTELEEILTTIESQTIMSPQKLLSFFWDTFVADTFLGNFDRHNGNWGFLVKEQTNEVNIAPLYDCGSCLYPQLPEAGMVEVMANPEKVSERLFVLPNSAIKENGKKINYMDFLTSTKNRDCLLALQRIVPRIKMTNIHAIIDATPSLTMTEKTFYKFMLQQRLEKILQPTFQRAQSLLNDKCIDSIISNATSRAAEINAANNASCRDAAAPEIGPEHN